jgi:hypothetical protein
MQVHDTSGCSSAMARASPQVGACAASTTAPSSPPLSLRE